MKGGTSYVGKTELNAALKEVNTDSVKSFLLTHAKSTAFPWSESSFAPSGVFFRAQSLITWKRYKYLVPQSNFLLTCI